MAASISRPGELKGRQTGRMRELEEGWNGRDSPWRSSFIIIISCWQHGYLTLIDCGPSRFAIWRPLLCQDAASIVRQLETVFCEREAPVELLTDNATTFSGETFFRFAERWGVRMRFRCAYVPAGNGIVERSHRTIKRIAPRTRCLVMEAVYW